MPNHEDILGVVLAGGLSRRMGEKEKSLMALGDKPLISHSIQRLAPQVDALIINANGDAERFSELNLPVVADTVAGYAGPLAGVLTGMSYVADKNLPYSHVLCVAADTPFFPKDICKALCNALSSEPDAISIASSNGNNQPVFGLWPVALKDALYDALAIQDIRKVMRFAKENPLSIVPFENYLIDDDEIDPFFNVNTPQDAELAEVILEKLK